MNERKEIIIIIKRKNKTVHHWPTLLHWSTGDFPRELNRLGRISHLSLIHLDVHHPSSFGHQSICAFPSRLLSADQARLERSFLMDLRTQRLIWFSSQGQVHHPAHYQPTIKSTDIYRDWIWFRMDYSNVNRDMGIFGYLFFCLKCHQWRY